MRWLSLTGISVIGALWVAVAVTRKGFGGHKELLGLILIQQVLAQGITIAGIVAGILGGRDNIFTAPEFTNTALVAEGRSWTHAVGHVVAILVVSVVLWAVGSLVILATRTRRAGGPGPVGA